jgi:Zn-dependent protease
MIRIPGIIPINIYPIFWLLSIAIAVLNSSTIPEILIWIGIVFFSVLIHEFGHAITALFFGQKAHIDLLGFGGLTKRHGKKLKKWQDFLITLNGPLAGFLFYLICMGLYIYIAPPKDGYLSYTLFYTATINLFWTVLNLLPIQPLDGGHLLRITLEGLFGLKGMKIALFISIVLAGLMTVLGFVSHQLLIGIIFFMFTFENYRLWKSSLSLTDFDQDSVLQNMLKSAKKDLSIGNFEGALNQFQQIRDVSSKGIIYAQATESMAEILDQLGKYEEGFDLLKPLAANLNPESVLLYHKLAFQSNHFDVAAKVGDKAYQLHPDYEVALINSLSNSIIDEKMPAIGWLNCAIRDGLPNIYAITTKPEYDNIRHLQAFRDLQSKYR